MKNEYMNQSIKHYKEIAKEKYDMAYDEIFNKEVLFLCANGDNESLNRVVFLLSSVPIEGVAIAEGTEYNYMHDKEANEHDLYIKSARKYNQKCNTLIDLSIAHHLFPLAQRVIPLIKTIPDPLTFEKDVEKSKKEGRWVNVMKKVTYSNIDKENTIKKINKAIDDGVFPSVTEHIK